MLKRGRGRARSTRGRKSFVLILLRMEHFRGLARESRGAGETIQSVRGECGFAQQMRIGVVACARPRKLPFPQRDGVERSEEGGMDEVGDVKLVLAFDAHAGELHDGQLVPLGSGRRRGEVGVGG